jgi:hypothetical protein
LEALPYPEEEEAAFQRNDTHLPPSFPLSLPLFLPLLFPYAKGCKTVGKRHTCQRKREMKTVKKKETNARQTEKTK